MNKTAIKNFSIWARKKLIEDITYKAGLIGVSEKGIADPLSQSTNDLQFFDIGTKDYAQIAGKEIQQRNGLMEAIKEKERDLKYADAFKAVIEEIAYTWFNRLVAIRFMEVNDYLPSRVRVLSSENSAKNEPDFVTTPFDTDLEFTTAEQDKIMQLKDENKLDELFRMLFIKQCNKLHEILPEMFEKTNDYTELLLSISFTDKDGVVYHLVHDIEEADWQDQVQIIGWLYQYYNAEKKDEVFAALKKNVKITKENIPAATQLFTPDWIVRYMVENSLGHLWVEGHPNEELKSNWKYYLEEAEQEPDVQAQLEKIRAEYHTLNPEDIKVIDPCMGSGHILVYCFDVLMQIYESQGYTQRDAAQSIVRNNLFGLDIDKRAAQLAYFAVMMKARQYDRRFFDREIAPNVYGIRESNGIDSYTVEYFCKGDSKLKKAINTLLEELHDAKEYGSILNVTQVDFASLYARFAEIENEIDLSKKSVLEDLLPLVKVAEVMAQKYDVVVTNPPYMGSSGMGAKLNDFVKKNYPDSKSDMSTVCMEKFMSICKRYGYMTMINIPVWMFLSSYEKLREKLLSNGTITSMVHPGRGIFGSDFGTVTFVFQKSNFQSYRGVYRRLFDQQGEVKSNEERELAFFNGKGAFTAQQSNFSKIPGSPVAYWVSTSFIQIFSHEETVGDYCFPKQGLHSGNNDVYFRYWHEPRFVDIMTDESTVWQLEKSWAKLNKGGTYRKWYGNREYVIFWRNNGAAIKCNGRSVGANNRLFLQNMVGFTDITSYKSSFRYYGRGFIFDVSGPSMFNKENAISNDYLLGLLNSKVCDEVMSVLSPTIHMNQTALSMISVVQDEVDTVTQIVQTCIDTSRSDWDSFETSWDFTKHPLIRPVSTVADAFSQWKTECDARFAQLKANEEELNRIFIDIYGLQDELTPEVEDKDVTVRKADLQRDIKSLISYAVGCMFGRYSLDVEGLAYAGGQWDDYKYSTFIPDRDNCIPITDEPYFEDDIVGLFCAWLKKVYGAETLEENLDFIAKTLGNKGATSREVIRNYFLKDFYTDHLKVYQKRPIYWLFDSGKQNGFKALVYMHRWNADTVGNLRVEYLHKMQHTYEREIQRMQETIDDGCDAREVSKATKRKDKLQKQLKETQDYDAKLAHIALSRIDIDLDDGVKVNYEKVQTGRDGKKMQILTKI